MGQSGSDDAPVEQLPRQPLSPIVVMLDDDYLANAWFRSSPTSVATFQPYFSDNDSIVDFGPGFASDNDDMPDLITDSDSSSSSDS